MADFSIPQKRCTKCGIEKPATTEHFHRSKKEADGLHYYCKVCVSAYQKSLRINGITPAVAEKRELKKQGKKRCAICSQEYPAIPEYFCINRGGSFGLYSVCKTCQNAKSKEYRQTPIGKQNAKKREVKHRVSGKRAVWDREYKRRRRRSDVDFAERERLNNQKRNLTEKRKQWRRDHYNSDWGRAIHIVAIQRRRARKKSLSDTFDASHFIAMVEYWGKRCAYCCKALEVVHCDHYIPLQSGDCPGTIPENILPSCIHCNSSKKATPPETWIKKRFSEGADEIFKRIQDYFNQL